jgi:c-di-GMP phosphodiesterase
MFGLKKLFSGKPATANDAAPTAPPTAERTKPADNFLCREALFDRKHRPAGHLLRLQPASPVANAATGTQKFYDAALLDTLTRDRLAWANGAAFIPLSSASLALPLLEQLPASNFTVNLFLAPETTDGDDLGKRLAVLRARGLGIAVVRQPGHPLFATAMAAADHAVIDVAASAPDEVRQFSAAIRANDQRRPARLLALNVDTLDEHQLCHQWHFDLFHGPFAVSGAPKPTQGHADPHKVQLLNLMRLVQGDAETAELAAALKQDPLLTFRILRYLNSAASGLSRQVESIEHALTLLGRQRLTRWLAVLLFSVREPDFADWLLVESALTRGKLMEILGTADNPNRGSDPLFLTGIFSCLDRLLRRPLADALEGVPLSAEVRQALLERTGPFAELLAVAEASEAFDLGRIKLAAETAGLDPDAVNHALLAATSWANEVTEHWE